MKLYNTPSREVVELELDVTKAIKIYTCGPTVYDYPHIGNWYTFIRYDLLVRTLRALGYKIEWVMNITDVGHLVSDADDGEDKLEKGAKREGKTAWDVAAFYNKYFQEGMKRLNFSEISNLPKATEFILQQIELVQKLEEKGFTYVIDDGVYFDTSKFPEYADFAHLKLSDQEEGARIETNEQKRNASDFAVWKFSRSDEKRDMEWDSPWGKGFPGWHLECSAMIHAILGEPIDIHAGGTDHIPIHHTNEIAQTKAAFGQDLSRYWMHCNHILVDGKKMAKSDGSFITLEDIEKRGFSLDVFRLHVLSGHYRSQSEFSWENIEASRNRLQSWVDTLSVSEQRKTRTEDIDLAIYRKQLHASLEDDLNTPEVLALIDTQLSTVPHTKIQDYMNGIEKLTGLRLSQYLKEPDQNVTDLINEREEARKSHDWTRSDEIRNQLLGEGIKIQDSENGTVWSRVV